MSVDWQRIVLQKAPRNDRILLTKYFNQDLLFDNQKQKVILIVAKTLTDYYQEKVMPNAQDLISQMGWWYFLF